jgi:hypothetical protein
LYKTRYKGLSLTLSVLNSALGGSYVCFGVFSLYSDPALDNALEVALQLALSVPLEHVLAYPKVSKSYYAFIEILFRNHISTALALDTIVFMQLMNAIHDGLQASDATLSSTCANTIDHLASFYFMNQAKDKIAIAKLNKVSSILLYANWNVPTSTHRYCIPLTHQTRSPSLLHCLNNNMGIQSILLHSPICFPALQQLFLTFCFLVLHPIIGQ